MNVIPLSRAFFNGAVDALVGAFGIPELFRESEGRRLWGEGKKDYRALVAVEEDGAVSGVVTMHRSAEVWQGLSACEILTVAVAPHAQGRGVGRRLVLTAEEVASMECLSGAPGFLTLQDKTADYNDAEKWGPGDPGFYRKLGFRSVPGVRHFMYKPLNQKPETAARVVQPRASTPG